jgi:hypothetical protein
VQEIKVRINRMRIKNVLPGKGVHGFAEIALTCIFKIPIIPKIKRMCCTKTKSGNQQKRWMTDES